jgi:transcription elongation factor Elf1
MPPRKAIPEKMKKKIYQEANLTCPICGERDVTTFEIHHIQPYSEVKIHNEENLIMLCSNCHSKVTANEIQEIDILRLKMSLMKGNHSFINESKPPNSIELSSSINNGIIANNLEIKTNNKKVFINPPEGAISANLQYKNYIKYLIDRYHEFKKADSKQNMDYWRFYSSIKKEFGAKWDMIHINKFEILSKYIQDRIDKTILGKNKKAQGFKIYSTFEEHLNK